MVFLVGLGLFVAFCSALLNPYGRKLLLTMVGVIALIIGSIAILNSFYTPH